MLSTCPNSYNDENNYKKNEKLSYNIQTDTHLTFTSTYVSNFVGAVILKISQGKPFVIFVKTSLIYTKYNNKK